MFGSAETGKPFQLVGEDALTPEQRNTAVWRSMCRTVSCGEGVWDPDVWDALEHPADPAHPPHLFLVEIDTGEVNLVPHLPETGRLIDRLAS